MEQSELLQWRSEPIQIQAFQTSIWDETLYAVSYILLMEPILFANLNWQGLGTYHPLPYTQHLSSGNKLEQVL